jgi:hypothetical protein
LVVLLALTARQGELGTVWAACRTGRALGPHLLSALLLTGNWLIYVWGVNAGHVIETSLGYFLVPLVNVAAGRFVLHEHLRWTQWVAIASAAAGVGLMIVQAGRPPWIALALAATWGGYGLMRKRSPLAALPALTVETLRQCVGTDELYEVLMAEATAYYEAREEELGAETMRNIERQVMLRIIDQRWREHLYEMDYLQEGINLRAMGQKDPLAEWQREGYEMFGAMMKGIAQDFVKYVMHVQVVRNETPAPVVQNVQQSSSDNVLASGFTQAARAAMAAIRDPLPGITHRTGPDIL